MWSASALEWHLALTTEIVLRSGGRRIPIQVWPWARHTAQIGLLKNSVLAERPRPGTPFGRVYRDRTGDPTVLYPQFPSEVPLTERPHMPMSEEPTILTDVRLWDSIGPKSRSQGGDHGLTGRKGRTGSAGV